MKFYARQLQFNKVLSISLIFLMISTFFSCSSDVKQTSTITLDVNSIVKAVRSMEEEEAANATNDVVQVADKTMEIKIEATVRGETIGEKTDSVTVNSEDDFSKEDTVIRFESLPFGENVTVAIKVSVNGRNKYKGSNKTIIEQEETSLTIELSKADDWNIDYEIEYDSETITNTCVDFIVKLKNRTKEEITDIVFMYGTAKTAEDVFSYKNNYSVVRNLDERDNTCNFAIYSSGECSLAIKDIYGETVLYTFTLKNFDFVAPDEVTCLQSTWDATAKELVLSWENPKDPTGEGSEYNSPFDHVVIFYTTKDEVNGLSKKSSDYIPEQNTIESFTFTATGEGDNVIPTLNDPTIEHTFKVKTVDKAGNSSAGKTISFPEIPLIKSINVPEGWAKEKTVNYRLNHYLDSINCIAYKAGSCNVDQLIGNEGVLTDGGVVNLRNNLLDNEFSFTITANGTYTLAVESGSGRKEVKEFTVSNIDTTPPAAVTLSAPVWNDNKLTLSWAAQTEEDNESNSPIHYVVSYNVDDEDKNLFKDDITDDSCEFTTEDISTLEDPTVNHTFFVKVVDEVGNESEEVSISYKAPTINLIEDEVNNFFNVGDLILTNGKVIRYHKNNNFEQYITYKENAVAVIFKATDGEQLALGVGVKQTYCNWAKDTSCSAYTTSFKDKLDSSSHTDGSNSWTQICSKDESAQQNMGDYPIFNFANNYPTVTYKFENNILEVQNATNNYLDNSSFKDDWYIPTTTEFAQIYTSKEAVNKVLQALGAKEPKNNGGKYDAFYNETVQMITDDWYWTSNCSNSTSNYADYYDFSSGNKGSNSKVQQQENTFYVLAIRKF